MFAHLPFDAPVAEYAAQAEALLAGWRAQDPRAVRIFRSKHPKFLDERIPWLERRLSDAEAQAVPIDAGDAALALARWYDFRDWPALEGYAAAVADTASAVSRFERAVEAVIEGDAAVLRRLLGDDPSLVHARSTRVTPFDPPVHRATLLHYLAANGVEGHRQRSPANAVEMAMILLDAGADPDALQDAYGGRHAVLPLLVSSSPPREAGVQVPLVEMLLDHGASIGAIGDGAWTDPLLTALIHGSPDAAHALVRRGARVDSLPAAAGLGRVQQVAALLPGASADDRHSALALAAQLGHVEVVTLLLDAGEDVNRFNPPRHHAHATPLHQAIAAGHLDMVALLVSRGARLDVRDTIFQGTPLGWAEHCGQPAIAAYLREKGAV